MQSSSRLVESKLPSRVEYLPGRGVSFTLTKEQLAAKSAKFSALLKERPQADLWRFLDGAPAANSETSNLVAMFCLGYQVKLSAENVVPLSCLAHSLEMTETHCPNNLLHMTLAFFGQNILQSWTDSIKALQTTDNVLHEATCLGLVDACLQSITDKVLAHPYVVGEPILHRKSSALGGGDKGVGVHRPNPKRRLFLLEGQCEDHLIMLPLRPYKLLIQAMIQRKVPSPSIAASIIRYMKKWVFSTSAEGEEQVSISKKEVIEAMETLLPQGRGLLPCALLFEMLHFAVELKASSECRDRLEDRIGKQLEQANAKELLLPYKFSSTMDIQSNIESLRRILNFFYGNYTGDISCLIVVARLIEEFLAEMATDPNLDANEFILLSEISNATSHETRESSDGMYRAISIYLDNHQWLTETKKEKVCQFLDCHKLSKVARKHAVQNQQLPTRVVVQVLFQEQVQLEDSLARDVIGFPTRQVNEEDVEAEEAKSYCGSGEEMRREMENMGNKVMELEQECYTMRREIDRRLCQKQKRVEKASLWGQMKRKLSCKSNMDECRYPKKKMKMR